MSTLPRSRASPCTASATAELVRSVIMSTPSTSYQRRAIVEAMFGLSWLSAATSSALWPRTGPASSIANWAARTEPLPTLSATMLFMSVSTPIFTGFCAHAKTAGNSSAAVARARRKRFRSMLATISHPLRTV
jgi:hypothetical protein